MLKDKRLKEKLKNVWPYLVLGALLIVLYWVLNNLSTIVNWLSSLISLFTPFIMGGVIAFIFNVPMRFIERHIFTKEKYNTPKMRLLRRTISYIFTLLIILAVIITTILVVVPQLATTIADIVSTVPEAAANFSNWLLERLAEYPQIEEKVKSISIDWKQIFKSISSFMSNGIIGKVINGGIGAVSGIVSGVTSFFIGFVFSVYILFQKEKLSRQIKKIMYATLPDTATETIIRIAKLADNTFANFLSGQCMEAVILGTMFVISMSILRMPYALLIGVVIAVTALVPIVGAFMGCIIGVILIGINNPLQALAFIALFLILQQIEGNLIYPHVVGNSVGLPGMWVLVAVTIGGNLFGIMGMLTFIPICSVAYALLREFINNRLKKRNIESLEYLEGLDDIKVTVPRTSEDKSK